MTKIISLILIVISLATMPTQAALLNYQDRNPDIKIYAKEVELKSQLKNYYSAYYVSIENKSPKALKIIEGEFEGGKNGGDAYMETRKDADKLLKKRVHKWEDWGVWTFGWAWALAFIIAPFEWYHAVFKNRRAKDESLAYCQDNFFNTTFYPDEKMEKLVLFPIEKPFYLRLTLKDIVSKKIYVITKDGADESF
ncbi:MAG: hypothetical protein WCF95_04875 [bacterium]